jgi:hypothetical protein
MFRRGAEAQRAGPGGCLGAESSGEQHERRRRKSERNFAHGSLLMCCERTAPLLPPWRFDASTSIAQLGGKFTRRSAIRTDNESIAFFLPPLDGEGGERSEPGGVKPFQFGTPSPVQRKAPHPARSHAQVA